MIGEIRFHLNECLMTAPSPCVKNKNNVTND